jgi:hypothetical protein
MTARVHDSPTDSNAPSRRALLVGALGGIGAWAAAAVGRASPVRADGQTVLVGGEYATATSLTRITNQTNNTPVFEGSSTGSGEGVRGISDAGNGVRGFSETSSGVRGTSQGGAGVSALSQSGSGVFATNYSAADATVVGLSQANGTGVAGKSAPGPQAVEAKPKTGVYGEAVQDAQSRGVWGQSNGGQGVRGQATSGVGVYGKATTGFALQAAGRAKFSTSGVATIATGNVSVLVNPGVNVTSGSFVLLTSKANIGSRALWFTTNASTNRFTIRMSSSRSSGTKVAWLLLG